MPLSRSSYTKIKFSIDLGGYLDESMAELIDEEIDGYAQSEEFETIGYLTVSYFL